MGQLCSFAHQINDIYKFNANKILEVGIGNGFVSTYLKRAGYDVTTVDINCELGPDLCLPISELEEKLHGKSFDLVVCCEVLEHMPFSEFLDSIRIFRKLSSQLYLTLPNYNKVFGIGGFLGIPKIGTFPVEVMLELPSRKILDKSHFWEINSSKQTSRNNIVKLLGNHYESISVKRYSLNPCHIAFKAIDN
jgi:SAM-dependent methyltransferase